MENSRSICMMLKVQENCSMLSICADIKMITFLNFAGCFIRQDIAGIFRKMSKESQTLVARTISNIVCNPCHLLELYFEFQKMASDSMFKEVAELLKNEVQQSEASIKEIPLYFGTKFLCDYTDELQYFINNGMGRDVMWETIDNSKFYLIISILEKAKINSLDDYYYAIDLIADHIKFNRINLIKIIDTYLIKGIIKLELDIKEVLDVQKILKRILKEEEK